MSTPYKRRRPNLLHNLYIYRHLVLVALVMGLLLWFIWANNDKVTIAFPFGLGHASSTTGIIILTSFLFGALTGTLATTLVWAIRVRRSQKTIESQNKPASHGDDDDLPPPDYAAKAGEGLPDSRWP